MDMPLQFFAAVGAAALRIEPLGSSDVDPAMPHRVVQEASIKFAMDVADMEPYFRTEEWRREFYDAGTESLTNMFCGIVMVENKLDIGYSTTPTVTAYRLLIEQLGNFASDKLLDWALRRRGKNADYTPTGRAISARSAAEYYQHCIWDEARRAEHHRRMEEQPAAAHERRAERAILAADHGRRSGLNRASREARLDLLVKKNSLQRLQYLASQDECPLPSLPVDIFQDALGAMSRLSSAELSALAGRLDQYRKLKQWRKARHAVHKQMKIRNKLRFVKWFVALFAIAVILIASIRFSLVP